MNVLQRHQTLQLGVSAKRQSVKRHRQKGNVVKRQCQKGKVLKRQSVKRQSMKKALA